ncbi:MAG: carboxymuconolactone decarboxylase family protein [Acidimicrobiia bacterium]|nr:carboxymuconolactone decarboxylase family protein [Acidimicrobiia bacterium]
MMPPGVPPIALFRTFARNLPMATAMRGWGAYELSKRLSLSMRQREIVINRVTARCGCEYEWGVHIAFFAERVQLTRDQVVSLTHGAPTDPCWDDPSEQALIEFVDALHDGADVADPQWGALRAHLDEAQMLDVCMLSGWYHAISFTANATRVPLEEHAPRFGDYVPGEAGVDPAAVAVRVESGSPGVFLDGES